MHIPSGTNRKMLGVIFFRGLKEKRATKNAAQSQRASGSGGNQTGDEDNQPSHKKLAESGTHNEPIVP